MLSYDKLNAVDYPTATSGPAACGSCWLGAQGQEAVITQYKFVSRKSRWEEGVLAVTQLSLNKWQLLPDTWVATHTTKTTDAASSAQCRTQENTDNTGQCILNQTDLKHLSTVKKKASGIGLSLLLFRGVFFYIPVENWLTSWCQFEMLCSDYNGSFIRRRVFSIFNHQLYMSGSGVSPTESSIRQSSRSRLKD